MVETYFLMYENQKVAVFSVENGNISKVQFPDSSSKYLPVGISTIEQLHRWIANRCIPFTRQGLNRELVTITPFEYMLQNMGLSLTDHYWICNIENVCTWESINLYVNDFKARYSLNISDDRNIVPSSTLQGDLKKKWIIESDGTRYLVKGNCNNICRQSISEVLATEIHKRQNKFRYTPYKFVRIKDEVTEVIGCACPNFTNINTEFVPAIDIVRYLKVPNNMSLYEFYIEVCKRYDLDLRSYLEYQIMTDFIITNTDRHLNNFGILRDSRTGKFLTYAPIFDSGNSMFYKGYIPVGKKMLDIDVTSFTKKEVKLMSYVTNRDLVNISLLPSDDEVYNLLKVDKTVNEETNERIVHAYNLKIKFLEDFQNGAKIWSYNYRK